ncbi:hypothetical protein Ancab_010851 [Ancistrocladus abbreviatus]
MLNITNAKDGEAPATGQAPGHGQGPPCDKDDPNAICPPPTGKPNLLPGLDDADDDADDDDDNANPRTIVLGH